VNNELVTIRRAVNHFHGICLEGLGKATPFVRIASGNSRDLTAGLLDYLIDIIYRLDKRKSDNRDSAYLRIGQAKVG
jgi:hypothetical protein